MLDFLFVVVRIGWVFGLFEGGEVAHCLDLARGLWVFGLFLEEVGEHAVEFLDFWVFVVIDLLLFAGSLPLLLFPLILPKQILDMLR